MILIITNKQDVHIECVTNHFDTYKKNSKLKPIEWVRINVEDFAKNIDLNINMNLSESNIYIKDSKKYFYLNDIQCVWYRKPEPIDIKHFELDSSGLEYIEAEFNEIILGIYALLSDRIWINNPFKSRISHRKLLQLKVAKDIGFKIPQTLISNSKEEVLKFCKSQNWDIAIKSLGAISVSTKSSDNNYIQYGIFTRRINKEEIESVQNKISHMPTQYQEYVKKKFELRITCVGEKIFACKINSQDSEITSEDMRFDTRKSKHEPFNCDDIKDMIIDYLKYFELNFGCFDFAVDLDNNYIFFECNPNGQWLWIEELTDLEISKAIADYLIDANNFTN